MSVQTYENTYKLLALAVVERAIADLDDYDDAIKQTAISFLTEPAGEWADSRELWTGLAGLDAETVRQRALSIFASPAITVPAYTAVYGRER